MKNKFNFDIHSNILRLIDQHGKQIGIMSLNEALKIAKDSNLDLVEVQPMATPPVVKVIDKGKFQFSLKKKESLNKKKNKTIRVKEIKFRINTDNNDYQTKIKNLRTFLQKGNSVKITVYFKGREIIYKENGLTLMNKICNDLSDLGKADFQPKFEGKSIIIIVRSKKCSTRGLNEDENKKICL